MNESRIDEVRRIKLVSLIEDPEQPRKTMRGLDALVESLRKLGQTTPILVCRTEAPETFMVVDGWRRCTAAKELKWEDIECVMSGMDRADVQFCAEFNHLSLNPFERADELFRFKYRHGWTDDQMASILGQSRSQVTSMLKLRTLPEPIRAMLLPVCSDVAMESLLQVARAKNAQEMCRLAELILQGRGSKELRGERTASKEKPGKAKQESSPSGSHDATNTVDVSTSKADVRRAERTSSEKMRRPTSPRRKTPCRTTTEETVASDLEAVQPVDAAERADGLEDLHAAYQGLEAVYDGQDAVNDLLRDDDGDVPEPAADRHEALVVATDAAGKAASLQTGKKRRDGSRTGKLLVPEPRTDVERFVLLWWETFTVHAVRMSSLRQVAKEMGSSGLDVSVWMQRIQGTTILGYTVVVVPVVQDKRVYQLVPKEISRPGYVDEMLSQLPVNAGKSSQEPASLE